jgi:hypothetical protein
MRDPEVVQDGQGEGPCKACEEVPGAEEKPTKKVVKKVSKRCKK